MFADQLTAAQRLAPSIIRVLSGDPLEETATSAGRKPADLADAVAAYHAAGLAALEQYTGSGWHQVWVSFADWDTAETIAARQFGPRLDQLVDGGNDSGWWFLRKHPHWRLRFARLDVAAVDHVLDEFTTAGTLIRWRPTVYEPETAAFGGLAGIEAVHDLFFADTRGVLEYLRQPEPGLGRREMSLLLLGGLLHTAGLDWFERGDVFARVAQIRAVPDSDQADDKRMQGLVSNVRGLLALPVEADSGLFTVGGPTAFAAPWREAYTAAGRRLAEAATAGTLQRGLRAVIAHIVIFHWNRFGVPARTQGILARAAVEAFLSRK